MIDLLSYVVSFFLIWFGAGLIISSVDGFSSKLKVSSFALSFFVLGILTSIPEMAVGLTSISEKKPEIFVGNLLGGIPVIFLFVIPILAALGNGIKFHNQLSKQGLIFSLIVIAAPSIFILDKKVTTFEGLLLIIFYIVLFYFIEKKKGVLDNQVSHNKIPKSYSFFDLFKILAGIVIVIVSSKIIVEKTVYFSSVLGIPAFFLSLIVLSLGTNLPELSLAIRSVIFAKKDIALGDYMGSAAANTLLFGIFTLLNNGKVLTFNSFFVTTFFIITAVFLFYIFSKSKNELSRKEGFIMLATYIIFAFIELSR